MKWMPRRKRHEGPVNWPMELTPRPAPPDFGNLIVEGIFLLVFVALFIRFS